MKFILSVFFLTTVFLVFCQGKIIDHNAYSEWNRIEKVKLSNQGTWLTFEVLPLQGDGYLHCHNTLTNRQDSMFCAKDLQMTESGSLMAWRRTAGFDTLRSCELNKVDKKKWPKDTLIIYDSNKDTLVKIPQVKRFQVAESNDFIAYLKEQNDKPEPLPVEVQKKCWLHRKEPTPATPKEIKSDGTTLVLRKYSQLFRVNNATDFVLSKQGTLAYITQEKGKQDTVNLFVLSQNGFLSKKIGNKQISIKSLQWNKEGTFLSFLYSSDTNKVKQYNVGIYHLNKDSLITFGDSTSCTAFNFLGINDKVLPVFFDYLPYLKLTLSERNIYKKDTLLESEKVRLDLWSPQDLTLQPQQLLEIKDGNKHGTIVAMNLNDFSVKTWCEDTLRLMTNTHSQSNFALVFNYKPYAIQAQWQSPMLNDVYRLDLNSGDLKWIKKAVAYEGHLSNDGQSFTYFEPISKNHYLLQVDNGLNEICMSCAVKEPWEEDLNGQPMEPGPAATYGFNKEGNLYYYGSRDNIYEYDLDMHKNRCLTIDDTKNTDWEWVKWNPDSTHVAWNSGYFQARNRTTKKVSIWTVKPTFLLHLLDRGDFKVLSLTKAKDTSVYVLRRMRVDQFPDVEIGGTLGMFKRASWANPQQSTYNWATAELIQWKSYNGFNLEGIVYKPENYDPTKKYPLLVYYYELNGDNLHSYRSPSPSASTINPTEYASAGYVVLIPDIRYNPGHPAKGAFDCIMSGTDFMLKNFAIDSARMGLQGQSWGGYQTAQLITMTNRYKAAMAGAPVSNMVSAYGGIRWGSGLNRQFQYESTQSRIGATLWERPDLFIENSPIFHLPKVNTPLLVMANDKDGAVPWYQGIELYTGLRRLGKPCWMLNYNDDDHNLTRLPNKMDLSIRMRQFFDFYLNNGPEPRWMREGIDAKEKGKELKYETTD